MDDNDEASSGLGLFWLVFCLAVGVFFMAGGMDMIFRGYESWGWEILGQKDFVRTPEGNPRIVGILALAIGIVFGIVSPVMLSRAGS